MNGSLASLFGVFNGLPDALLTAEVEWLLIALSLHVSGLLCRGIAWHGVLRVPWPEVTRRRTCAWFMCGAGLAGVITGRGGDVVKISLAKREIPDSTWPGLAGSVLAEGSFETLFGIALTLLAVWFGVGQFASPSPLLIAGLSLLATTGVVAAIRLPRVRKMLHAVKDGAAILGQPRRYLSQVLPWQITGCLLHVAAVSFFLAAFGLPTALAVIVAACWVGGSSNLIPLPGLGAAAAGAALLVVLPAATSHPVESGSVGAMAIGQAFLIAAIGVVISLVILSVLFGANSPRSLMRTMRGLMPTPAD